MIQMMRGFVFEKIRVQMRCIDVYTAGENRVEENKMCIIFIRKQLLNFGVDEYAIMNNGFVLFFLFSGES